ncbi:MAG: TRAP transporter substrate-binding protein DctP [Desulfopila sp.]
MQHRYASAISATKRQLKKLILVLIALAFVIPMYGSTAFAKTYRWRVQHPWPSGSMYDNETKALVQSIKEMSDGRLDITMFGVGTLAGTLESLDSISKGVYEGHISVPVYWSGKMPVGTFLQGVTGGISTVDDWSAWYYKYGGLEIAREAYKKFKVYYVAPIFNSANTPTFTRKEKPVRTLDDFKGLKLRSTAGLQSQLVEALGASPVWMPVQDVYTALETGVIDGVTAFSITGWKNMGIQEIASWSIEPGFILPHCALEFCVSEKAWNNLPRDLQLILESAVRQWSYDFFSFGLIEDAKSYQVMKEAGVKPSKLTDEEMTKVYEIARRLADAYAEKDSLAHKAWESQKAYLQLVGKLQ